MSAFDPRNPTGEQLASDRAVFRFQRYVEKFRLDLSDAVDQESPLRQLSNAIYIPVAPRSQNGENHYLAKFCRTYCFTKSTIDMLTKVVEDSKLSIKDCLGESNVLNGLDDCMDISGLHFEALFKARAILAEDRDWEPYSATIEDFIAILNRSDSVYAAHNLFVNTISDIPYTGMLPNWLDNAKNQSVTKATSGYAIVFSGKEDNEKLEWNGKFIPTQGEAKNLIGIAFPDLDIPHCDEDVKEPLKKIRFFVDSCEKIVSICHSVYR